VDVAKLLEQARAAQAQDGAALYPVPVAAVAALSELAQTALAYMQTQADNVVLTLLPAGTVLGPEWTRATAAEHQARCQLEGLLGQYLETGRPALAGLDGATRHAVLLAWAAEHGGLPPALFIEAVGGIGLDSLTTTKPRMRDKLGYTWELREGRFHVTGRPEKAAGN